MNTYRMKIPATFYFQVEANTKEEALKTAIVILNSMKDTKSSDQARYQPNVIPVPENRKLQIIWVRHNPTFSINTPIKEE